MGFIKSIYMSQGRYGYYYMGDDYVCSGCFTDYAIQQFIRENADETKCSYCGSELEEPNSAFLGDVIEFIMKGIITEYGHPNGESIPYESAEGGYQGEVYHTSEIFYDEIAPFIENERLLQDIENSLHDEFWCQKDFYALPPHKALIFNWQEFSRQVKHRTRYVFFRLDDDSSNSIFDDPDNIPIPRMLDHLGRVLSETDLFKIFEPGNIIWRVRVHGENEVCDSVESCGPPLAEKLGTSSRMSPAGISMFYGALDEKTSLLETREDDEQKVVTISKWQLTRRLRFLDLINIPGIPSLFDPDRRKYRSNIRFLWSFRNEISQPISKDGLEHVDYVPTQVFTEYIRHLYMDNEGNGYDGILYPSCKNGGHTNCVIFCDQSNCIELDAEDNQTEADASKYVKLIGCRDIQNRFLSNYIATLNNDESSTDSC